MIDRTASNGNLGIQLKEVEKLADGQLSTTPKKLEKSNLLVTVDRNRKTLHQIEEMHQRLSIAREWVALGYVHRIQLLKNQFRVEGDESGDFLVNNGRCECHAARSRSSAIKGWCDHRIAVELFKREFM